MEPSTKSVLQRINARTGKREPYLVSSICLRDAGLWAGIRLERWGLPLVAAATALRRSCSAIASSSTSALQCGSRLVGAENRSSERSSNPEVCLWDRLVGLAQDLGRSKAPELPISWY
jgi:hypothetical protein